MGSVDGYVPGAFDDMGAVREPVQQRGGHVGIAEDLGPVAEAEIRSDDHRSALVALGQNLEEQFRAFLGEGNVTEFIEDEQV
jgi:hypothetical protein